MARKITTEIFINEAKQIHGDKYDYTKVEYKHSQKKVIIICPEHGEFEQTPNNHLRGAGCPRCSAQLKKKFSKYSNELFIEEARKVHKNIYDYSKVNIIDSKTKVTIICSKHGEFKQSIYEHLRGSGCPKCSGKFKCTTKEFIEKSRKIHGNKYNYSKVNYINCETPVCIICSKHGEFWQTPSHHTNAKCGCPKCYKSKGELEIELILLKNNISYIGQYEIDIDKSIRVSGKTYIDFYLPEYNIAIEYNGKQHYIPQKHFGGQIRFESQLKRDEFVRNWCKENNIKLLEIPYNEKNIEKCIIDVI